MDLAKCFSVPALVAISLLANCSKDKEKEQVAAAATATASSTPASTPAAGQARFSLAPGSAAEFLIDAPLEKIKGYSPRISGSLDVNPAMLKKSTADLELDLDTLKTETFNDASKDATQTEHMKNWLEIGTDVEPKARDANRQAKFVLKSIDEVSSAKLADVAPNASGERLVKMKVSGDLMLHGVTSPKTAELQLSFMGPPDDPMVVHVVTTQPLKISLKEHDIKPRDLAGKFLAGSLEKIGQKIDDIVQISLDLKAAK
jgi:polyisoprenoid-binding protein YceI